MSKNKYISRFSHIIKKLQKGPASFEQIASYLDTVSEIQDLDVSISKRTLQRDIKEIYSLFSIEIANEKKGDNRYFIKSRPEEKEHSERLLESYEILDAINASRNVADYVFLETRKSKGLEHFTGLLYAIKNRRVLRFTHYKYWDETITHRTVHPLALKEAQGRWYLLAVDLKDNKLKSFGLDRIGNVDISKTGFREKYAYNIKERFQHAFGIITEDRMKLARICLKFNYEQGQYVHNFPLHHSQVLVKEEGDAMIFELSLFPTFDFIRELLSYGTELEVISPAKLRNEMKVLLYNALKRYQ